MVTRILVYMFLSVFLWLASCQTPCDVKENINLLKVERGGLVDDVHKLNQLIKSKESKISDLDQKLDVLKMYKSRKKPKHIVTFKLKQSHFTLDITTHIKDAANSIEFQIPVDPEFYNELKIGSVVVDKFRVGSFIMNGSFGDWEMTVKAKEIR